MKKNFFFRIIIWIAMVCGIFSGCGNRTADNSDENAGVTVDKNEWAAEETAELEGGTAPLGGEIFDDTTIVVFAEKEYESIMEELIEKYQELRPTVTVQGNYDDAENLITLLKENASCDVIVTAKQEHLDELAAEGLLVENTRYEMTYSVAQVVNQKADELERNAAYDFVQFLSYSSAYAD